MYVYIGDYFIIVLYTNMPYLQSLSGQNSSRKKSCITISDYTILISNILSHEKPSDVWNVLVYIKSIVEWLWIDPLHFIVPLHHLIKVLTITALTSKENNTILALKNNIVVETCVKLRKVCARNKYGPRTQFCGF